MTTTRTFTQRQINEVLSSKVKIPPLIKGIVNLGDTVDMDNIRVKLDTYTNNQVTGAFVYFQHVPQNVPRMQFYATIYSSESGFTGSVLTYPVNSGKWETIFQANLPVFPGNVLKVLMTDVSTAASYEIIAIIGNAFKKNSLMVKRVDIK